MSWRPQLEPPQKTASDSPRNLWPHTQPPQPRLNLEPSQGRPQLSPPQGRPQL